MPVIVPRFSYLLLCQHRSIRSRYYCKSHELVLSKFISWLGCCQAKRPVVFPIVAPVLREDDNDPKMQAGCPSYSIMTFLRKILAKSFEAALYAHKQNHDHD
jgi:hypothetical protein